MMKTSHLAALVKHQVSSSNQEGGANVKTEESDEDNDPINISDCSQHSEKHATDKRRFRELQVKQQKSSSSASTVQPERSDMDNIAALNVSQKATFDNCIDIECTKLTFVGKPGTGDKQHYRVRVVLTAQTGVAAVNINYKTVHLFLTGKNNLFV
ncbi:MAG: hypothetical protein MHMPM18_002836, partial [Marteilia pararefringens]